MVSTRLYTFLAAHDINLALAKREAKRSNIDIRVDVSRSPTSRPGFVYVYFNIEQPHPPTASQLAKADYFRKHLEIVSDQ